MKTKLTEENYFSPEANMEYFGHTQFLDFTKCEARALAIAKGEYEQPMTEALLLGQYVDACLSGTRGTFVGKHPEMVKKDGTLLAKYVKADRALERISRDDMFMKYIGGEKQKIMTGTLFGYEWKIKVDAFHEGKAIVDFKYMKDFDGGYADGMGHVNWAQLWGYDYQAAIYQAIVENVTGEKLPFIIAGVTKQEPADIGLFKIPQYAIDSALKVVEQTIDRYAAIKAGVVEPKRCENCDYCRQTKILDRVAELEMQGE